MDFNLVLRVVMSFAATIGAALLFGIPAKELFFCGLTAAAGWLVFEVARLLGADSVVATLFGTLTLSYMARVLSYRRKTPVTVYLIAGIFPLVPGAPIYYTMYEIVVNDDITAAMEQGVLTAKTAGIIAVGILIVLSLPNKLFCRRFSRTKV